jgi:hypothetical protein
LRYNIGHFFHTKSRILGGILRETRREAASRTQQLPPENCSGSSPPFQLQGEIPQ